MCGIFGASEINANTRDLLPILAYEMENRGDDSWGMTNGIEDIRFVGPITDNFFIPTQYEGGPAIFHTRAASVGAVTEANAHPFRYDNPNGNWIVGIHNGHISSHTALGTKYSRNFDVDSMHIFRHILDKLPLSEICGWGAIAWFDSANGVRKINLSRFNNDALNIVRLTTGELVFCSTLKPLVKGSSVLGLEVKSILKTDENKHYQIDCTADSNEEFAKFVEVGPMAFGFRQAPVVYNSHNSNYGLSIVAPRENESTQTFSERLEKGNLCRACKMANVDRGKNMICPQCEAEAYDNYLWSPSVWYYMLGPDGKFIQMDFDIEKVSA